MSVCKSGPHTVNVTKRSEMTHMNNIGGKDVSKKTRGSRACLLSEGMSDFLILYVTYIFFIRQLWSSF